MALSRRRLLEILCCTNKPKYTIADYITSNGQQIIDTGINPDDTTEVEYYGIMSNTSDLSLMGVGEQHAPFTGNRFHFYSHTTQYRYLYTGKDGYPSGGFYVSDLARYKMKKGGLYVNGVLKITSNNSIANKNNIWIFNCNNNGKPNTTTIGTFRCYGVRIWKQGELVRDMIPILDERLRYCLHDKITGQNFYDIQGGEFNGHVTDPDAPFEATAKMDITFENNKFENIGSTLYGISASRNLIYEDGSLKLASNSYFQIQVIGEFSKYSTIQVLVNGLPSTNNITNWFRFGTTVGGSYDLVFGFMTNEVLTMKEPFVVTFVLSDTNPTVVTYLNDKIIYTSNAARYDWSRLQIGAGDTSPKPTDLKIGRFKIFNEMLNDDQVKKSANELLGNK